jgi:hypothetical protein
MYSIYTAVLRDFLCLVFAASQNAIYRKVFGFERQAIDEYSIVGRALPDKMVGSAYPTFFRNSINSL